VDARGRRVGENEALFRQVNEELEALERGSAPAGGQTLQIVCECGDLHCSERITVPLSAYEDVRSEGSLFLAVPGHQVPSVEEVVAETADYVVVRKREGEARRLSETTNPRG
jgi:hypothetical protein